MASSLKAKSSKLKANSGFTLVELLVVIGITALLAGLLVLYGSTGRQQTILSIESTKISQLISRAKTLSISTYEDPSSPCGYGVRVDYSARTYALTSYKVSPDCKSVASSSQSISIQSTETQNTFSLPAGVTFNSDPSLQNKIQDVFFVPPDPKTVISVGGGLLRDITGYIYLTTADGSATRRISVNASGQITY